ncbi:MAG: site-2 protease family protein [Treponema sp.]|jgi:regulator of sigma E protease|nr:site-2 protease family protein [Treponema sp.]
MLPVKILLGLLGLGIVVFIHELGHFIAARLSGITVEAFSIGWGWPILKKKIGTVEYRLGVFPVGGYCKMKGENEFQDAWENHKQEIKGSPDSYFGSSPWRRIFTCFMGPFFNLVFAVLVLSIIWGIGFEVNTEDNRIVLLSDIDGERAPHPSDEAGLKTGDRIIKINGKAVSNYYELRENIIINPEKNLPVQVERDSRLLERTVRPRLDKSSGAGVIGIYSWTDPVIDSVEKGSPADIAGLAAGDKFLKINGEDFFYTADIFRILKDKPVSLSVEYERGGDIHNTEINVVYTEKGPERLGIYWQGIQFRTPRLNPIEALIKGGAETAKIFAVSVKSFGLLFRGIDLTKAVSGPVRITYMLGDAAAEGFGQGFGIGISSMANFLALISIALCIMNLLPLPIIDGGMILVFLIEGIRRKPLHPRAIQIYQTIGVFIIFSLMLFAVFGDILFLTRR